MGIVGDTRGWWEGFGFLTNLFSSTVSLMFALPFALLVVDRLSALNGQVAAMRDVATAVRNEVNHLIRVTNDARAMLDAMVANLEKGSIQEGADIVGILPDIEVAQKIGIEIADAAERWRNFVPNINGKIIEIGYRPIDEVSIETVDEAARQIRVAVRAYCNASGNSNLDSRTITNRKIEATREEFSFPTLSFFHQLSPLYFGLS